MHTTRRFLVIVTACVLLFSALPLCSAAQSSDDFTYEITADQSSVTITDYIGTDTAVTIPATIEDIPVTVIGANAFEGRSDIASITFPEGLQSIEQAAFASCTALTAVSFPDSLVTIGEQAFYNCYRLSTIDIGPYTYDIGYQAFAMTAWLNNAEWGTVYLGRVLYAYVGLMDNGTTITVKDGTAAIAPFAFQNREELAAIYLPVGIRRIGSMAFLNCSGLAEIRIPPTVKEIGTGAFLNASSTTVITTDYSVPADYAMLNDMYYTHDATLDYPDGDMTMDGITDTTDMRKLIRVLTGADSTYDHERYLSSDMEYDGTIDTADIRAYLKHFVSSI